MKTLQRTALITYALDRPAGGIGTYTNSLTASMRQAGVEPLLLKAGRVHPGEAMLALPSARRVPGLLTIGQVETARLARRHDLQLIHDPTGIYPLYLAGCRKVVTLHDVFPLIMPQTSTLLDRLIYRFWLPLAIPQADAVITVSQHSKEDILRCLPVSEEKIFVIPTAIPPAFYPLSQEQIKPVLQRYGLDFPYIFFAGSLEPRKNLLRLLQALAQLKQNWPGWHLVIAGMRNARISSPIEETIHALGLSGSVHFTGFVPGVDLPALYCGASLLCFPSLYEGFGLPVLEAMACGTPVVTSDLSSLPEIAGEAALLVNPYDVDQISAAMQRILSDPELAEDLRLRGLARARQFTLERMAEETLAVYYHVLNAR